jgi:predicted kinase
MSKIILQKPALILLYGYPGSGKTYLARQLCDGIMAAHVSTDRIRTELFETPVYDKQENAVVNHLTEYMISEFLNAGVSVVYDVNATKLTQRRKLRDIAKQARAVPLLIWLQIDPETAYARTQKRDRRTADDKYAMPMDRTIFERLANTMQNPDRDEDHLVISGKHSFTTQRGAVMRRLYELGCIQANEVTAQGVKPGMVNLVPSQQAGRVDYSRRNINIH